ncbi:MAG: hypothetical protein QM761_06750 [Pseudoxanthomonas sp.]
MSAMGLAFRKLLLSTAIITTAGVAAVPWGVRAQDAGELAKQAQNPVAHMISVPFQNNFNFGVGPKDDLQYVLNIQPVVPFKVNENWNLVTRTIIPLVYQPELAPGIGETGGLGDIQASFFFSPAKAKSVIWGAGPVVVVNSASQDILGTGKTSLGLSAVALTMKGHWVIGGLISNVVSVSGDDDRSDINQLTLQPFVNYNLPRGWYLVTSPLITANWKADSGQRWTIPVGGGIGRVIRAGHQALNLQLQAFDNVEHPDGAAEWSLRFQIQLLFPH